MGDRRHCYAVEVLWTGNIGNGTSSYRAYERAHDIAAPGKPTIRGSSDPAFRGDQGRWNPEELLVASLSACHQLWFLSLCAEAGVCVTAYQDQAEGSMVEQADGSGAVERVILRPCVTVAAGSDADAVAALHGRAHAMCFIARSVRFPVLVRPTVRRDPPGRPAG